MREIVIISGKGGTGKTTVCAAFAHLAENKIICDLDVDAPDLHILLEPRKQRTEAFFSGLSASIDPLKCVRCGRCAELCAFGAVQATAEGYAVDALRCEGCGVCAALCPHKAIDTAENHCGDWYVSDSRFGLMVHAQLFPGQENSGRLVSLLKAEARSRGGRPSFATARRASAVRSSPLCPARSLPWAWWSPPLPAGTILAASRTCAVISASRWPSSSTRRISMPRKARPSPRSVRRTGIPCSARSPSIRWRPRSWSAVRP